MKVIDTETGMRIGKTTEVDEKALKKKLKEEDPILRNADKDQNLEEFSAMDPPEAYSKEHSIGSSYDLYHPFIKELMDEHKELSDKIDSFDKSLSKFKDSGYQFTKDVSDSFNEFFTFFDNHIQPHNEKEEKHFFRILHDRLIESGEHSPDEENPNTAVQLMEDDHNKFIQLATLSFNMLGLATRLPDLNSRGITFDLAYNNGRELIELLKLHIYREDEILFPLAHKLLKKEDYLQL